MTNHSPDARLNVGFPELLALFYSKYTVDGKRVSLKEIKFHKERNILHLISHFNHFHLFQSLVSEKQLYFDPNALERTITRPSSCVSWRKTKTC